MEWQLHIYVLLEAVKYLPQMLVRLLKLMKEYSLNKFENLYKIFLTLIKLINNIF